MWLKVRDSAGPTDPPEYSWLYTVPAVVFTGGFLAAASTGMAGLVQAGYLTSSLLCIGMTTILPNPPKPLMLNQALYLVWLLKLLPGKEMLSVSLVSVRVFWRRSQLLASLPPLLLNLLLLRLWVEGLALSLVGVLLRRSYHRLLPCSILLSACLRS